MNADQLVAQLKALAHPERLRLVNLLAHPEQFPDNLVDTVEVGVCVNDLATAAQLPQSTASHHLAQLRRAQLVQLTKSGHWRYVRPNTGQLAELAQVIASLGTTPAAALD